MHIVLCCKGTDLACTTHVSGGISNALKLGEWLSSSMVWELVDGLFRGLALFSARSWPEGKPFSRTGLEWHWTYAIVRVPCVYIAV